MNNTLITSTDSYKASHFLQFPQNTGTYYYIEARRGGDEILFFGLQAIIKKILSNVPSKSDVEEAAKFWEAHGVAFNKKGWMQLADLGYYPLEIRAVKEGHLVDIGEVQVTIESTHPDFGWLPGWIETRLLQIWYPCTVATRQFECKKIILKYLNYTGDPSLAPFKLHSFGYRGTSSEESAAIGGMAELTTSMGTDTIAGIFAAQKYYNTDSMLGFSINAAEHSTITSWGRANEANAYKNFIDNFLGEGKIAACVSDSYDLSNAIRNIWGKQLKSQIFKSGGTLVVRPDSGEPSEVVLRSLNELEEAFGSSINKKGYKVLPDCIRLIQGDGISSPDNIEEILSVMEKNKWSADNIAFGMGGGSLQQVNRDTYGYAMKISAIHIPGEGWRSVYKQPKDCQWKKSKAGRFDYLNLPLVWKNGKFFVEYTFEEIRKTAMAELEDNCEI